MPDCPVCGKWFTTKLMEEHLTESHGWTTGEIEEYLYPDYNRLSEKGKEVLDTILADDAKKALKGKTIIVSTPAGPNLFNEVWDKTENRKKNIEWSTNSWNWVTGCPGPDGVHCPGCYAKSMANRLKGRYGYDAEDPFKVTLHPDKLYADQGYKNHPSNRKKPSIYFNCSMGEWVASDVQQPWLDTACKIMKDTPRHIFITLSKQYANLWRIPYSFPGKQIPDNVWVGISVCERSHVWGIKKLVELDAAVRFLSIEPMTEDLSFIELDGIDWIIIGARTRHGSVPAFRPHRAWVQRLVEKARGMGVKVFLKPNLNYLPNSNSIEDAWYQEPVEEMPFHLMPVDSVWYEGEL